VERTPAFAGSELEGKEPTAVEAGKRLLQYQLAEKIGEGGMGVVWRATDTDLGREVAVKFLPDNLGDEPERLARFEREARLLASLNHPHIAVIHGLHEAEGQRFLAMELVQGQDLHKRLQAGPLPVDEALAVAQQVAAALEAAHDSGVIHRDLKPANIVLTPEDSVKVLDFGLAKALSTETASGSVDHSLTPTLTSAGTVAGMILGTAAYMSPEQAKGKPVDRRADVWSFGAVLYEMLAGRKAFEGEVVSETLASVLKSEPDWSALPARTPAPIRRLLERCLEKDPRRRLRDIGDVRLAIEDVRSGRFHEQPAVAPAPVAATRWSLLVAGVVAALAIGFAAAWLLRPSPPPARPIHVQATLEGEFPMFSVQGSSLALSPDGRALAYVTGLSSDVSTVSLHLRPLDRLDSRRFDNAALSYNPFFSPDGQWVGFVTPTELKKVAVAGGTPLTLCPVNLSRGASWGEGGTIVFAISPASGLMQIPAAGGTPRELTTLQEGEISHRWPQFLPGGRKVLFTSYASSERDSGRIELVDLDNGQRTLVHEGGTYARYAASGHLLFVNGGTLFAAPFDPDTGKLAAMPSPVLEDISTSSEGGAMYDIATNGTLVYLTGRVAGGRQTLVWADARGVLVPLSDVEREYGTARISPDGRRLAVEISLDGNRDIWVFDLERNTQTRLTFDEGPELSPVWSPDGVWVYYSTVSDGKAKIHRKRSDGSGPDEVLADDLGTIQVTPYDVSPDGRLLAYHDQSDGGDIWYLTTDGSGEPQRFFETPNTNEGDPVFSPDGRWLAYDADDTGEWEVYVRPFPGPGGKWQISSGGGEFARWSGDGRSLFFKDRAGSVWKVLIGTRGDSLEAGRPERVLTQDRPHPGDWDVDADGSRFLFVQQGGLSGEAGPNLAKFAFNWFTELEDLLEAAR